MARTKAEKEKIEAISQELIKMTGEFCDQYLDEDYKQLAEKLILKMKRKWSESPLDQRTLPGAALFQISRPA